MKYFLIGLVKLIFMLPCLFAVFVIAFVEMICYLGGKVKKNPLENYQHEKFMNWYMGD